MMMYTQKIPKMIPPPSMKELGPPLFVMITRLHKSDSVRELEEGNDEAVGHEHKEDEFWPECPFTFRINVFIFVCLFEG